MGASWIRGPTHNLCMGRWILTQLPPGSPIHEFKSWLYLLLVVWPWASYLNIQDLFSHGYNGDVTLLRFVVVQSLSRVQLFETPWTEPGSPVLHHLPECAQTHVRWVSDAIQPSHPLSPPPSPAFNLCQHQGLSQWVGSLNQVAKVLELQLQHQVIQWIFRVDFL